MRTFESAIVSLMIDQEQYAEAFRLLGQSGKTSDVQLHKPKRYRTVILSDIHIGDGCRDREVVGFLNHIEDVRYIYLNGDIIDGWKFGARLPHHVGRMLRRNSFLGRLFKTGAESSLRLPQGQNDVVQKLFKHARHDAVTYYCAGNHDEFLRPLLPRALDAPWSVVAEWLAILREDSENAAKRIIAELGKYGEEIQILMREAVAAGNIHIVPEMVHKTASNEFFLVKHGDEFDHWFRSRLGAAGTRARAAFSPVIRGWLMLSERLGVSRRFSLADYLEGNYEDKNDLAWPFLALQEIRKRNRVIAHRRVTEARWEKEPFLTGYSGGHTHIPLDEEFEDELVGKIRILNSGDWVKNCTALVEYYEDDGHKKGEMGLIQWNNEKGILPYSRVSGDLQ